MCASARVGGPCDFQLGTVGPHHTSQHHTSPHLTTPHNASQHLTSPHNTSQCLTTPDLTSPHNTSQCRTTPDLTSPHNTSPHNTSPHRTSPHLTAHHLVCVSRSNLPLMGRALSPRIWSLRCPRGWPYLARTAQCSLEAELLPRRSSRNSYKAIRKSSHGALPLCSSCQVTLTGCEREEGRREQERRGGGNKRGGVEVIKEEG